MMRWFHNTSRAGVASASQRRAASISGASCRSLVLYSLWASSRGSRCPTRRGAAGQPVPLVVAPEQDLRHGQAGELGVGDVRRPSRPAAAWLAIRDDPVGQFHVECGQEGVQVGGHDGLRGPEVWLARVQRPSLFAAGGRARDPAKPVSACSGRAGLVPGTWRGGAAAGGGQRSLPALSQAM